MTERSVAAFTGLQRFFFALFGKTEWADYGKQTLKQLSKDLTKEFGKGFSVSNLQFMRRFYQSYQIQQTVSVKLSWSHYCELLTISDPDKRSFYEKETINSGWSIRELKRQISTSLYERINKYLFIICHSHASPSYIHLHAVLFRLE